MPDVEIDPDRAKRIASRLLYRPRVFCMEWVDPVYCSVHWVPEMVRIAGGVDELGRRGADSVRISWNDIVQWAPEVLIVMPCGCGSATAADQARQLAANPGWSELPAVRDSRVYAVDANSYFARPGPRLIEGTELLAHLLHPVFFDWTGPSDAFREVENHRTAKHRGAVNWKAPRGPTVGEPGARSN